MCIAFGWGYGQVKGVFSVRVVVCLGSVHELLKWCSWHLQSYIYFGDTLKSYAGELLILGAILGSS